MELERAPWVWIAAASPANNETEIRNFDVLAMATMSVKRPTTTANNKEANIVSNYGFKKCTPDLWQVEIDRRVQKQS